MTITYQSRSKYSTAARFMAVTVLLVLACAAWLGLDGLAPDATKAPPAPAHVWGNTEGGLAEPTGESPFASGANGALPSGLTGIWVGSLDMGTGNHVQFSFDLREAGGVLSGTARFPIGEANIEEGKVVGTQLSFTTRHRLPASGQSLMTQFKGELSEGLLQLTLWSEGAQSHLRLRPFPG